MDARERTRPVPLIFVLIFLGAALAGCTPPKVTGSSTSINWQNCSGQQVKNSFLVKWRNQIPPEFARFRLHPQSLVTRFHGVDTDFMEHVVLATHPEEYEMAEHEVYLKAEQTAPVQTSSATWGPNDVNVADAWSFLGKRGEGVTVAVIDSGVDVNHPLLQNNIWHNTGEIPNNGIDDDHDGFVDDYAGYDFNAMAPETTDGVGHGTHVSGIIAGQADGSGFTGIAPGAKIMALKFMDSSGQGSIGDAVAAMDYALVHGAKVINASWGGPGCSDILKQEIMKVTQGGVVFASAAGNSGQDLSAAPEWPAAYQVAGKITVGSYNSSQFLSYFSDFGLLVDLAAPGENILSTIPPAANQPEGQMGVKNGTSMATPFVAGVAALLYSAKPNATTQQIAAAINNSVVQGRFGVRTQGKLNALQAAQYLMSH